MATFGFIGTGNMGGALARAARKHLPGEEILLANRTAAKAEALAAELGCMVSDNRTAAAQSKYLFLGVKPQMMAEMLSDIAPVLSGRQVRRKGALSLRSNGRAAMNSATRSRAEGLGGKR